MSTNEDETDPHRHEDGSVPLNPYAVPIEDHREVVDPLADDGDGSDAIDLAKLNGQAKWYIATGLLLAFSLILLIFVGIFVAAPLIAILQFAWVYPALRHSSKYAKYLNAELRIGLRLVLVFHFFVLALATIAIIFFVTCLAIFSTAGN